VPVPFPILSQISSVHAPIHCLKIHFNIMLPFMPCLPNRHINIHLSKIITTLKIFPNVSRTVMMLCSLIGGYQLYSCLSLGRKSTSDLKMVAECRIKYWYKHTNLHWAFIDKNVAIGNSYLIFSLHVQMFCTYVLIWIIILQVCT
jgi:hypothetical protein